MKTERVLFIENAELQQVGGGGTRYAAGEVYELRPDQAQRWYSRGKAVPAPEVAPEAIGPLDEIPPPDDGIKIEATGADGQTAVDAAIAGPTINVDNLSAIDANLGTRASGTSRPATKLKGHKKS